MKENFEKSLATAMAIAGGVVIPAGLVLSSIFGGLSGFLGAFAGFTVATLNSLIVVFLLKWAMKKPVEILPSILMGSYFLRLLVLAGILYGLTCVESLNTIALLSCFLALYVSHTAVEMFLAWKSLGVASRKGDRV
ncbi:MAG: hypothetical protein JW738_08940 [Actinobacteria bacterium]|nr:hypothetical protein [Actinomycetota bacterium]